MDPQTAWIRNVLTYVCPFVRKEWFDAGDDAVVFVSVYRVYRVPLKGAFSLRPLTADFGGARAVYIQWDASYQKVDQNIVEGEDGALQMELHPVHVYRTGEGVLLLLMAPLPSNYDGNDEDAAKEQVSFVRSIMVALLGRNAAYEYEFDMVVDCGDRSVMNPSPVFATPVDERPAVNKEGMELVSAALEKMSSLDETTQNRVSLALRWYQRSFGDDRLVRDPNEEDIDGFINLWLAWETLVMERYNDINSITRALADIHECEAQRIGELFPVGRIYGLRGDILHQGQIKTVQPSLIRLMTDVFADLLLHVLELPSGDNTRRYMDGRAQDLF